MNGQMDKWKENDVKCKEDKKHQFTTKLKLNDKNLDEVNETTLLGTVITNKLTWDKNTEELAKK